MHIHDLYVKVWIKNDPCCVLRAVFSVQRAACFVEVWFGFKSMSSKGMLFSGKSALLIKCFYSFTQSFHPYDEIDDVWNGKAIFFVWTSYSQRATRHSMMWDALRGESFLISIGQCLLMNASHWELQAFQTQWWASPKSFMTLWSMQGKGIFLGQGYMTLAQSFFKVIYSYS